MNPKYIICSLSFTILLTFNYLNAARNQPNPAALLAQALSDIQNLQQGTCFRDLQILIRQNKIDFFNARRSSDKEYIADLALKKCIEILDFDKFCYFAVLINEHAPFIRGSPRVTRLEQAIDRQHYKIHGKKDPMIDHVKAVLEAIQNEKELGNEYEIIFPNSDAIISSKIVTRDLLLFSMAEVIDALIYLNSCLAARGNSGQKIETPKISWWKGCCSLNCLKRCFSKKG